MKCVNLVSMAAVLVVQLVILKYVKYLLFLFLGDSCEMCKPGFYGDATVGRAVDCIACPCYDPRVVNNTCVREDNIVKCSFCQPGYVGNLCDQYVTVLIIFTLEAHHCTLQGSHSAHCRVPTVHIAGFPQSTLQGSHIAHCRVPVIENL